ncbi:MAG: hypothetical protein ACI4SK_05215 [Christensenellales bacterium]
MKNKNLTMMAVTVIIVAVCCCFVLPGCDIHTLDKDYFLPFDPIKTTVFDISGIPYLLTSDSGLELRKDGTLSITVIIDPAAIELADKYGLNLGMLQSLDLKAIGETYGKPILPWFDITDVKGTFDALKQSLGSEILIDYDDVDTQKLIESIQTDGKLSSDLKIPSRLGFRYVGEYEIKNLASEVTGEKYTALYVDKYSENGEPYLIMTMTESEDAKKTVTLRVEFLNLTFVFTEI